MKLNLPRIFLFEALLHYERVACGKNWALVICTYYFLFAYGAFCDASPFVIFVAFGVSSPKMKIIPIYDIFHTYLISFDNSPHHQIFSLGLPIADLKISALAFYKVSYKYGLRRSC